MIKAARKAEANAELARAFADIFRAPTHEHREIFCAECAKKIGMRMCGALRERQSAEQCVL